LSIHETGEINGLVKEVDETNEGSHHFQVEETHLEAFEGELLILSGILNTRKSSTDKEQRDMIFYLRYTINKKVCNLIIDGKSCTIVASTILSSKLSHPTKFTGDLIASNGLMMVVFSR